MNRTQIERTKRLHANNREKGLKRISVWVPASKSDELKALAAKLRDEDATL